MITDEPFKYKLVKNSFMTPKGGPHLLKIASGYYRPPHDYLLVRNPVGNRAKYHTNIDGRHICHR